MYVGVDIGGTKTLVAVLDEQAGIAEQAKFPTSQNYGEFLGHLRTTLSGFRTSNFTAGGVAIPAVTIDREHGIGVNFGNLPWQNVPIKADLENLFHCHFVVENDAKLAGLSEAMLLQGQFQKVLYITVSTGIGIGLVVDGKIDLNVGDGGGRALLVEHEGQMVPWESFASGHAIVERYGKMAQDITDETTWQAIACDIAKGLIQIIALAEPEVIVIGGSVGTYFDRYGKLLKAEIEKYPMPLVKLPELRQAQRPEEAVIFGCYDLAKQVYGNE